MATLLGTDKDVEELARRARKAGWTVTIDGNNHIRWDAPHGGGFRSALTGSRGTRLQVERNLARHDPAHFGGVTPVEAVRRRVDIGAEVDACTQQLLACVDMLRDLAAEGCAGEAAELLRMTRDILREGEDRIRARSVRRSWAKPTTRVRRRRRRGGFAGRPGAVPGAVGSPTAR